MRSPDIPVYRERVALQALVDKGWLPATKLYPAGPSTIYIMIAKGWVQPKPDDKFGRTYKITASGEKALRAPIPSSMRRR